MPPHDTSNEKQAELILALHASPRRAVLAVTGGGSGALSTLLKTPGASATVLEAVVPYAAESLSRWIGGPPEQSCSERTARAMAMRSFEQARSLDHGSPHDLIGLGCTASLATDREKRGDHRIHLATQTATETKSLSLQLDKGALTREQEEAIAEHAVIALLADAAGVKPIDLTKTPPGIEPTSDSHTAPRAWTDLLLGEQDNALVTRDMVEHPICLLPGSFNPTHEGHRAMASVAERRLDRQVVFELSMANVDKPLLDFIELRNRIETLGDMPAMLTRAATFVEKARVVPGCAFAVGADTAVRIGDPRYYNDSHDRRDAALAEIGELGCRFLVFGRKEGKRFVGLEDLGLSPALESLCEGVSEQEFRVDMSSSELREAGD